MKKKENIIWWIIYLLNLLFLGVVLYFALYYILFVVGYVNFYLVYYHIKKINKEDVHKTLET